MKKFFKKLYKCFGILLQDTLFLILCILGLCLAPLLLIGYFLSLYIESLNSRINT